MSACQFKQGRRGQALPPLAAGWVLILVIWVVLLTPWNRCLVTKASRRSVARLPSARDQRCFREELRRAQHPQNHTWSRSENSTAVWMGMAKGGNIPNVQTQRQSSCCVAAQGILLNTLAEMSREGCRIIVVGLLAMAAVPVYRWLFPGAGGMRGGSLQLTDFLMCEIGAWPNPV